MFKTANPEYLDLFLVIKYSRVECSFWVSTPQHLEFLILYKQNYKI